MVQIQSYTVVNGLFTAVYGPYLVTVFNHLGALFPFSFSFLFVCRRQWKERRREKERGREKSSEENESIRLYQSFSTRNPNFGFQSNRFS
jgi:hypothetical protein